MLIGSNMGFWGKSGPVLNPGLWNNSGTANPATGADPMSWAASGPTAGSTIYVAVGTYYPHDSGTVNLGGSPFLGTVPSGFSSGFNNTTINPSDKAAGIVLSDGNLTFTNPNGSNLISTNRTVYSTTTGKYYFEFTINQTGAQSTAVGVSTSSASVNSYIGSTADSAGVMFDSTGGGLGKFRVSGSGVPTSKTGDVFGVAIDLANQYMWLRNLTSL